jgi:uncharacterized protein YndB with AHSA1/START domain
MSNQTVSLHRVVKANPEKLFRAFTDPAAYSSWIPPYGFLCHVHQFEAHVGGGFKMSFTNFTTGHSHAFGGTFQEMEPNKFIKFNETFDDPGLKGEMTTSIWFEEVSVGTELKIVQENIPVQIPTELCYLGWQESLEKLIKLVEPEIHDA